MKKPKYILLKGVFQRTCWKILFPLSKCTYLILEMPKVFTPLVWSINMMMYKAVQTCMSQLSPCRSLARASYSSQKKINLKNASSKNWLLRQMKDKYGKQARIDDYRCRSAYKLLQINERYKILQPGMRVVDCGAAPGSWSQVASRLVNSTGPPDDDDTGFVLSLDRDFFQTVEGCLCVRHADFTQQHVKRKVRELLGDKPVDILLSDMAPNASGHPIMDHFRIVELNTHLLDFAVHVLKEEGTLVCKLWSGDQTRHFMTTLETVFDHVRTVKPEASRVNSAELFILARGYKNPKYENVDMNENDNSDLVIPSTENDKK